jgi:hypothetical protein
MQWRKLGLVFCPQGNHVWMRTHAANTVAEHLDGDLFRVYFSTRDAGNRSSIGWVDVDLRAPDRVLRVSEHPVIGPGRLGTFDDSGASMAWLTRVGSRRYLYYLGWNLGVTVPWRNSIGLAISESADGEFVKLHEAPIVDRSPVDPFSISYPCVLRDGLRWRMWYGSNLSWGAQQADMAHLIKYAESDDGIVWRRDGRIALPFQSADEYAMSKPCVLKEGGRYRMWYSFRGARYRIGYAESSDGLSWERQDHRAGIDVSEPGWDEPGWDEQSVEYPYVFEHRGQKYMLYNGNGYGLTGFGLAVLERDD